jgi:hypothetical protein
VKPLSKSSREAAARRERYTELRRQGMDPVSAACEAGVHGCSTRNVYEHWFQAAESGQEIVPGRRRRPRS